MHFLKNILSYSSLEVIFLGAIGSILGVFILWIVRKPLPKLFKWLLIKLSKWIGVPINEQKEQVSIMRNALKKGDYELALSFYFFHMFQALLWIILASTSFIIAFLSNSKETQIIVFFMGLVLLLLGAFYNGGIIMSVYSEQKMPIKSIAD